jgi:hypothetical protein
MLENASVWRRRRTPYINCNLLISFIYLIDQNEVSGEPYLGVVAAEVSVRSWSMAAAAEEEAGVEVMVEETGSSSIDGGRGDQWSRERRSREQWSRE